MSSQSTSPAKSCALFRAWGPGYMNPDSIVAHPCNLVLLETLCTEFAYCYYWSAECCGNS
ncbi:hypothetical protein SERLA73DRAFT_121840 [Serpula lacrymans var. lacrymans S7.3]|uniref:Uncharacterized protein n=2 Tax=Serpula lacrymans var. lacrymans TaxID=341189 RepID=F8PUV9_SERL3|nr:uncharacterized protein SERLADRAFT_368690 [Serpula lacrymans var. lacrymans S7.9]EGN99723.1 hypothetical protein SERLA73DRAFT_121840 [Serpula lacrymans var. lacrymans S7.3]EGO25287.1 hypothetical protein SERLADRAFT_368690 [Serpula lacrymans var. lacrymans S7.9]